ncbi:MAG: enoyl CoA dehydratase/isomerase [Minwuia thermotolerans]|nr:MAG: enoyl CoA dehydratase/isomerase [Minwuia thermotolerans]
MAVNTEAKGRVLVITLDRPEARNAVNGDVASGIEAAIDKLENDPELWVGIIQSSGTVFCAGADLKEVSAGNGRALSTERGGFAGLVKRERTKPLIAAVNGAAVAGGCEIVLSCDMVIAAEGARFGLPEVKRSLAAAAGGLFRLPRAVGTGPAMEMILTGDPISADRAYQLGLVNHVVPLDGLSRAALDLADRIVVNAPLAVRASREIAVNALKLDDAELWKMSAAASKAMSETEDFKEGPRAFIEKRDPVWKGR